MARWSVRRWRGAGWPETTIRYCEERSAAQRKMDCFAEPFHQARIRAPRWLAMTVGLQTRQSYRFLFTGLRFSMNAAMPSARSSSANVE